MAGALQGHADLPASSGSRIGAVNEFPGMRCAVAVGIVAATGSADGEAVERLPVDCHAIDPKHGSRI
jgi:hypothetical protein